MNENTRTQPLPASIGTRIGHYLSLVKFGHTVFALPFACIGFALAWVGDEARHRGSIDFGWLELLKMLLCMVFARSAAMAFNRWLDRHFDALNARTARREIPAGVVKPGAALMFTIVCCLLFIATTATINPLVFALSPVALAVILFYSYTKRITPLCHLVLGTGLALAPIGAYLVLRPVFDLLPIIFSAIVLTWVSAFDIIAPFRRRWGSKGRWQPLRLSTCLRRGW